MELNHFDAEGRAVMVDVGGKEATRREAVAKGKLRVCGEAFSAIQNGTVKKGDVLGVARIAGIMAVKKTAEIIPLCHPLPVTQCGVEFALDETALTVEAICTVSLTGRTGVEMEALTGVSAALLTIYDMCKAIDKGMVLEGIHLATKTGGKSGDFVFGGGRVTE